MNYKVLNLVEDSGKRRETPYGKTAIVWQRKRVANKKEKEHLAKVASLGCYVCERPANVHHIRPKGLGIGRRSSHYDTIPLCYDHHQGQFSIHNDKINFEKKIWY